MSRNLFGTRPGLYSDHVLLSWLSGIRASSPPKPRSEDLEGFRAAQRLAYDCALAIGNELHEGDTEEDTAAKLQAWLSDHGAPRYLHRPFAWFGEHSRFSGYEGFHDYHPGKRRLKAEDVVILDVSPIVHGYTGDIGYTLSLSPSPALREAQAFLRELRAELPELFMSRLGTAQIWRELDRRLRAAGYTNCHALYPFSTLAHRVYHMSSVHTYLPRVPLESFGLDWFSGLAQNAFLTHGLFKEILNPDHRGSKLGLWAIEPHLGGAGFGAKFEEILVVEPNRAYWLDDDVPHMKQAL
jgi:hypothetical protein